MQARGGPQQSVSQLRDDVDQVLAGPLADQQHDQEVDALRFGQPIGRHPAAQVIEAEHLDADVRQAGVIEMGIADLRRRAHAYFRISDDARF